jgi:hypothetical protein
MLVGLVFGHLYCMIEAALPGSFRGSEQFTVQLQIPALDRVPDTGQHVSREVASRVVDIDVEIASQQGIGNAHDVASALAA